MHLKCRQTQYLRDRNPRTTGETVVKINVNFLAMAESQAPKMRENCNLTLTNAFACNDDDVEGDGHKHTQAANDDKRQTNLKGRVALELETERGAGSTDKKKRRGENANGAWL